MKGSEGLRLLGKGELDAAAMWSQFPPRIAHAGKKLVLERAGGATRVPRGTIRVARYAPRGLPRSLPEDGTASFRNV